MNKSFQRMSQSLRFKNSIVGFCRILEVHPQEKNQDFMHPHFHVILAVRSSYFKIFISSKMNGKKCENRFKS